MTHRALILAALLAACTTPEPVEEAPDGGTATGTATGYAGGTGTGTGTGTGALTAVTTSDCGQLPALLDGGEAEYPAACLIADGSSCEIRSDDVCNNTMIPMLFFDWSVAYQYWNVRGFGWTIESADQGTLDQGTTVPDLLLLEEDEALTFTTVLGTDDDSGARYEVVFRFDGQHILIDSVTPQ